MTTPINVIIPLCGKGERFAKQGFATPKPEIKVKGKEIIRHTIDSLNLAEQDNLYIITNERTHTPNLQSIISTHYPRATIIPLQQETIGPAQTIQLALPYVQPTNPCLLVDADNFYTADIISQIRNCASANQIVCFETKNEKPVYSYIKIDERVASSGKIIEIAEKQKISNFANTGAYYFATRHILNISTQIAVENTIKYPTQQPEPYISHAIASTLNTSDWYPVIIPKANYISLGTPEQVSAYVNSNPLPPKSQYAFLFDLDGTLVQTDAAYYEVWREILAHYNIFLTKEIYETYIFSNADADVKQKLLPTAPITTAELTAKKDDLFLKHLNQVQTIAGAQNFIQTLFTSGHKVAVVTNSNRPTAEAILKHINIQPHLLVIGSECSAAKPSPDPYLKAMEILDIPSERSIIFEDSKNGIISGRGANARTIVGISNETNITIHTDADIVVDNYTTMNSEALISYTKRVTDYVPIIYNSLKNKYEVEDIQVSPIYLKGGFIADVLALNLTLDKKPVNAIIKLMTENDSALNKMAHFLDLYGRENYFYESIAPFVPINTPKCYGLLRDEQTTPIGFILEDLRPKAIINKNLSTESIDQSLEVISSMAKLHAAFWEKPLQKTFPTLRKHNDSVYQPSWKAFLQEKLPTFQAKWQQILSPQQLSTCQHIIDNFNEIQDQLSTSPLTLCHGDVKSPNIFYEGSTPHFIDWQYISNGKGVQDLVFFIIESFSKEKGLELYPLFKSYYYTKLKEYGVTNYSQAQYNKDIQAALCHFPFFVAIWFGTTPTADLIDVNFPYFFIQKLFTFYDAILDKPT
jgi:HAD superfamily hydrolase (TIGR01509 family)